MIETRNDVDQLTEAAVARARTILTEADKVRDRRGSANQRRFISGSDNARKTRAGGTPNSRSIVKVEWVTFFGSIRLLANSKVFT